MRTIEPRTCSNCGTRRSVLVGEIDRPTSTLREWVVSEINHTRRCDSDPAVHGRRQALAEVLWQLDRRNGVDLLEDVDELRRIHCCDEEKLSI